MAATRARAPLAHVAVMLALAHIDSRIPSTAALFVVQDSVWNSLGIFGILLTHLTYAAAIAIGGLWWRPGTLSRPLQGR